MFGRKKPLTCAICTQPIHRSWDIGENGEETEYKSHSFFGDTIDKQKLDSLLDRHHKPMTREELKEAQARVKKISPNHPSLSEKVAPTETGNEDQMHNVINLEQFRNRRRPE